jgi:branched-chain amino acid transport system permease protein
MQYFLQQFINGLSVGSIYALIAVGYTMVYGVLQLINFAHGDVFMVGAVVALFVATGRLPAWMPWWMHCIVLGLLALSWLVLFLRRRQPSEALRAILPFLAIYLVVIPTLWLVSATSHRLPPSSWRTAIFTLLVAVMACGLLGFLIERLAYRPLRDKPRINSLITAIGISLLLEFGGQHRGVFGPTPRSFPQIVPRRMPDWVVGALAKVDVTYRIQDGTFIIGQLIEDGRVIRTGIGISFIDLLVLATTLLLMLGLTFVVLRTKAGLGLRAVSYRFDTAALMGVNIDRTISFTFVTGSVLAAVAGVLFAVKYPRVEPLMGLLPGIKAFIAAVFGGIGNIGGAVAGAMIIGLVEVMVVGYVENGSQYRDAIAFVLLIAILLIKPSGLFGKHVVEKV